jgi:DNA-binding transcriptional LysR family regulator
LRTFEAVAKHLSISRAAAELHLTQPAVSMQLKQLEEQIGLQLLQQSGRRMSLTEAGQELRGYAQSIAAQMTDLGNAMEKFRSREKGVLRLAVVSPAIYFLPKTIAAFTTLHPGVRVSLDVVNREAVLSALEDSRADLAITGQPPEGAYVTGEYFKDNPLVVIASTTHKLATSKAIPLHHLAEEVLVLRESGSGTRATADRYLAERGVAYRPGCELSSNEAVKQAVQAGLGIGIVPAQAVQLELETARLTVLDFEGFPLLRRWFIVYRNDKRLSAVSEAFKALLLAGNASIRASETIAA